GLAQVEHLAEVRVVQPRRQPRLFEEHLHGRRVFRDVLVGDLERDALLEAGHALDVGDIDESHSAAAELTQHTVLAANQRARVERLQRDEAYRNRYGATPKVPIVCAEPVPETAVFETSLMPPSSSN